MTLRRIGKPVHVPTQLYAVIDGNEVQALFPADQQAHQWASQNFKGRKDVTVEAVRFDEQKGAG